MTIHTNKILIEKLNVLLNMIEHKQHDDNFLESYCGWRGWISDKSAVRHFIESLEIDKDYVCDWPKVLNDLNKLHANLASKPMCIPI